VSKPVERYTVPGCAYSAAAGECVEDQDGVVGFNTRDPSVPSLGHIGEMMEQHGGHLRLPEQPAAAAGAEIGQTDQLRAPEPSGAQAKPAAKAGLLDDVLGACCSP
jgi:hypothetical protein